MADTDKEIFAAAMADAPAEAGTEQVTEQATEQPETPQAEGGGPQRDPATGKFTAKAGEAPATEQTRVETPPAGQQQRQERPAGEADHRIPLAEHLNEREKRQAAEARASQFERQMETMNRRLEELQKPKGPTPDIYTDADAFVRAQIDPVQKQQEAIIDRFSRLMAVQQFTKPVVDAAYAALETAVRSDPNMRLEAQRIWQNEHPYGALVDWHKRQEALQEIGTDPAAYKTKLREEFLKDPEFRKAVIDAVKAENGGQQNGQSRPGSTITRLPPSLNRVTNAASVNTAEEETLSDAELFRQSMRG